MTLRERAEARRANLRARYPHLSPVSPPIVKVDPTSIALGRTIDRKAVLLPLRYRVGHIFMTGTTGSGKSRLLLHIANQIVKNDEGLIFIEPHGSNSDALIHLLAKSSKPVHIIDFSSSHCLPFNPLWCPPGSDPSVIAGCALDAVSVSRSDEPMHTKPTTERVLMTIFYTAAALNLTFLEMPMLLDQKDEHGLRAYAIERLTDPYTRNDLKRLHDLSLDGRRKRDFDQEIIGPLNRLARLIRPPVLRNMLGQSHNTLDIGGVIDRGEIIVAKLAAGPQVYESDADLIGRLLLRSILFHAKRRTTKHPCTVMIDEASRYFSGDIPVLLTEVRKFNISVIAALQYTQQAEQHDENMLAALLNCCNIQVAFRAGDAEESEKRAHTMIPLDLEKPVSVLIKPTIVGYRIRRMQNESKGTQQSETDSNAYTDGESETDTETEGRSRTITNGITNGTGDTVSSTENRSLTDAVNDVVSSATSHSSGSTENSGTNENTGQTVWIQDDGEEKVSSHESRNAGKNQASGSSKNSGDTVGRAQGKSRAQTDGISDGRAHSVTQAIMHAVAEAESYSRSKAIGRNSSTTVGKSVTNGANASEGSSEALEPILQDLPTAVHGKDNMLYKAGQLLRSLPTGTAFISFVAQDGPYANLFTVPPVFTKNGPPPDVKSPIALSLEQAQQNIAERAQRIMERCKPEKKATSEKKGTWRKK